MIMEIERTKFTYTYVHTYVQCTCSYLRTIPIRSYEHWFIRIQCMYVLYVWSIARINGRINVACGNIIAQLTIVFTNPHITHM